MSLPCGSKRRWSTTMKMTLCLFFLIAMSSAENRNTKTIFDKKQKLEVQQQLKRLNKPALKSIKSPDGDIIDCVHINNQPAFDHPLLKNHTIQMRPVSHPKGLSFDESNDVSSNSEPEIIQLWQLNGRCPEGTIPIRRTKEEDLLRVGSATNYGRKKYHTIPNSQKLETDPNTHEYAVLVEEGEKYFAARAEINYWNPHVQGPNEFSSSQLWISGGEWDKDLSTIEAGVMVNPNLYGDEKTRIFTFWTVDSYQNTGCYNLMCPGFVQISQEIAMGASVTPYSRYGLNQQGLDFYIYKDEADGNWWLRLSHRYQLGYWPSSLFSVLSDGASNVQWGGEVINSMQDGKHTTTQMGSGHFAEEGPRKASFFKGISVTDGSHIIRGPWNSHTVATQPDCYNIIDYGGYFYFGGPGRNPNCP